MEDTAIVDVHPSPLNPRKRFDDLDDLAASIRADGILQPLIVRPRPAGGHEIVAGERRYRAAKLAGVERVPIVVRELDDAAVLRAMVVENVQRDALTPLEEAHGYHQLIAAGGMEKEALAAAVGKSRRWIYDRLSLRRLTAPVVDALEGERISAAAAVELARLEPADQARALDRIDQQRMGEHGRPLSLRELQRWIADHVEVAAPDGSLAIVSSYHSPRKGVLNCDQFRVVKSATACKHTRSAMYVLGEHRGEKAFVCRKSSRCRKHWGKVLDREKRERDEVERQPEQWRREEQEQWRREEQAARNHWKQAVLPTIRTGLREVALTDAAAAALVEWCFPYDDRRPSDVTAENVLGVLAGLAATTLGEWQREECERRALKLGLDPAVLEAVQTSARNGQPASEA